MAGCSRRRRRQLCDEDGLRGCARRTTHARVGHARARRFVLPTAFAALVAGAVHGAPEIVAVGAAGVVAFRTRSTVTALAAGLPAFWIAQGFLR